MTGTVHTSEPPTRAPRSAPRRRRRSFWRKFLLIVIVLFLLAAGGIFYLADFNWQNVGQLGRFAGGYTWDRVTHKPPFGGKTHVNILLLGVDEPEGGVSRSDTIKVISVNLAKERISMLSIPRDTWVTLPGHHGEGRINSAHQLGGTDRARCVALAREAVTTLMCDLYGKPVHIDRYVRIQTTSFKRVVEALGGVDLEVEKQMDYEDPSQDLFIHLKPGFQHLNAEQAVGYVRFRHDAEGDYGRIRRQDKFLRTLAAKINQPGHKERLVRLVGPLLSMVSTDLSANDAQALKALFGKLGGMDGIQSVELPTVPTMKGAASVVEIRDRAAAEEAASELFDGPRPTVLVLNGTKRSGLARDVRDAIDRSTFRVLGIGTTAQPAAVTAVYARAETRGEAERLAMAMGLHCPVDVVNPPPGAQLDRDEDSDEITPGAVQITLVLGKDFTFAPDISTQPEPPGNAVP